MKKCGGECGDVRGSRPAAAAQKVRPVSAKNVCRFGPGLRRPRVNPRFARPRWYSCRRSYQNGNADGPRHGRHRRDRAEQKIGRLAVQADEVCPRLNQLPGGLPDRLAPGKRSAVRVHDQAGGKCNVAAGRLCRRQERVRGLIGANEGFKKDQVRARVGRGAGKVGEEGGRGARTKRKEHEPRAGYVPREGNGMTDLLYRDVPAGGKRGQKGVGGDALRTGRDVVGMNNARQGVAFRVARIKTKRRLVASRRFAGSTRDALGTCGAVERAARIQHSDQERAAASLSKIEKTLTRPVMLKTL